MVTNIFTYKNNFEKFKNIESKLLYGNFTDCLEPKISIVIPIYNNLKYFKIALDSAINQEYNEIYEIVIVDNNPYSNNKSEEQIYIESLSKKNIFYYRNIQNIGMFGNWNRCIELARAPFITFCHNDDQLLPNCLSRLMSLQKKYCNRAIMSAMNTIDEEGVYISKYSIPQSKRKFLKPKLDYEYTLFDQFLASVGFGVGCLFNRQCMINLGGYNEEFYPSADYALQTVYTYKYGCVFNEMPTFNYRIATNESLNAYKKFAEADRWFRKCMMAYIKLPNFILQLISNVIYNYDKIYFCVKWGGGNKNILKNISIKDRIIYNLIGRYKYNKKFQIF